MTATSRTTWPFSRLLSSFARFHSAAPTLLSIPAARSQRRAFTASHRKFEDGSSSTVAHTAQTHYVEPAASFPKRSITLSDFDQNFVLRRYTTRMTCLRTADHAEPSKLFEKLALSLSRALAELPPLAGRLVEDDPARGTVRIKIDDKPSVALSLKNLSEPDEKQRWAHGSYADLAAAGFPAMALNDPILKPPELATEATFDLDGAGEQGVPILVAQANFIPGGVLLYVAFNHVAGDGVARMALMRSWARNTAFISAGKTKYMAPVIFGNHHWDRLPELLDTDGATQHPVNGFFLPKNTPRPAVPDVSTTIWRIQPTALTSLKRTTSSLAEVPDAWISTMDAVCALMWQRYAVDANLRERGIKMSTLNFAHNWRKRIAKALPEDYIGNTWTIRHVLGKTDQIIGGDLGSLAQGIRQAIKSFSPSELPAYQTAVRSAPHVAFTSLRNGGHATMGPVDFFISDQTASSEPLDFGTGLGKVQKQRIVGKVGYICGFVTSRSEEDGIEVVMNIIPAASERLKQDDTWKDYAELVTEY